MHNDLGYEIKIRMMISLTNLGLLNIILVYPLKLAHPWKSPNAISFFETADLDKDGRITEEEGLTNPNKAIVKEWVSILEDVPKSHLKNGLTRSEYEEYLRNPGKDGKYDRKMV